MKIAILEDEEDLLELLEFNLEKEGFDAIGFLTPSNMKKFIVEENPDLLIIDRNLPGKDGLEFAKEIIQEGYNIPIIFLTAKTADDDVIEGFNIGAEDYIKKPFNMKELIARIKVVLKRNKKEFNILSYKNMHLDINNRELIIDKEKINLTNTEFKILKIFFENQNQIISRDILVEELELSNEKSINVLINRIQHKIGNIFKPIRGVGYKLK